MSRWVIVSGLLAAPEADGAAAAGRGRDPAGGRPLAPAGRRARAEVTDGSIAQLSVYCTGDWDADRQASHARTVTLLHP